MKPILFKHSAEIDESFFVLHDCASHFYDQLHYHPLLQITIILQGEGTFFIADKMERFAPGELYFIGSNLPHVFRSDNEYFQKRSGKVSEYISIYFSLDSFGKDFFQCDSLKELKSIFSESERGIKLSPEHCLSLIPIAQKLADASGVKRFLYLIELLQGIANVPRKSRNVMATHGFVETHKAENNDAMSQVFSYVMKNFKKEIRLDDMAQKANMSRAAFCRYFKKRTQKSLIEFVLEVRIGFACKLLQEENLSVSEIAYECGFKNLSNFNRQFKFIMNKTPREYIQTMQNALEKKVKIAELV